MGEGLFTSIIIGPHVLCPLDRLVDLHELGPEGSVFGHEMGFVIVRVRIHDYGLVLLQVPIEAENTGAWRRSNGGGRLQRIRCRDWARIQGQIP